MMQDIHNINMMMTGLNFSDKEMMKFLALYQALKTIDNVSESESENEDEDKTEEAMVIIPMMNQAMKKKKKMGSKSSYGHLRKLGTRK